jgi:hypothetical protein
MASLVWGLFVSQEGFMESPIDELCGILGVSVMDLSVLTQAPYNTLYQARKGKVPIPRRVYAFINERGLDAEALRGKQKAFMEKVRSQLLARIGESEVANATG